VSDGVVHVYHAMSKSTRLLASNGQPFSVVVAISPNFVIAATETTLHVIYYTLPIVRDTIIWEFQASPTLYGTFHEKIPSLFMMWAETSDFSGLVLVPSLGILHANVVAPLFYPVGYDGGASEELNHRQHAHKFTAPDGTVALHTIASRTYVGRGCDLNAIDLSWRRHSTTVSAVILHTGGCLSVSVALDPRMGYGPGPKCNTLSLAHMLKVGGGTHMAVHSVGAVEIVCVCTGHKLAVVEFTCEPGEQPSSTLQLIKLRGPEIWKVEFDGTTFVARSGETVQTIPCTHLPAPPGTD
jgi:hypothetical protein